MNSPVIQTKAEEPPQMLKPEQRDWKTEWVTTQAEAKEALENLLGWQRRLNELLSEVDAAKREPARTASLAARFAKTVDLQVRPCPGHQ